MQSCMHNQTRYQVWGSSACMAMSVFTWGCDMNDTPTEQPWPFDQPPNTAALTLSTVLDETSPIVYAFHDEEDHSWQFLGPEGSDENLVRFVSMQQIVDLDQSVTQVADLPPGWHAWRDSADSPWQRSAVE